MESPDFIYYSTVYLGNKIAEADFPRLALRAKAVINALTFNRAETDTTYTDEIKMAICAVAEVLYAEEIFTAEDRVIKTEKVGDHSVTYADSTLTEQSLEQKTTIAAKAYLANTGLLYRGFYDGEYGIVPSWPV